ncbi:type IX secretion system sortase PorU [uncultured Porphyromonas sp.]|uniref:type IX secretion system sortase PorU n=1 Tax=uncultured Porphyromonas sp. TaxID=159274 RepID=UPI002804C91C|nr:type IX secretion system sortase PorU [uncultured Porphyromonas sp.]
MRHRLLYIYRPIYLLLLTLLATLLGLEAQSAANAPLREGHWARLSVTRTGVHKVTFAALREAGIDNPAEVRLFGRGGAMLSEVLEDNSLQLTPVPTYVADEAVYFYATGTTEWIPEVSQQTFRHQQNIYSNKGYYLATDRTDLPAHHIDSQGAQQATETAVRTSFLAHVVHEEDRHSLRASGRKLFGEPIGGHPLSVSLSLPTPLMPAAEGQLGVAYVGLPDKDQTLELTVRLGGETYRDIIKRSEDGSTSTYLAGIYHAKRFATHLTSEAQSVEVQLQVSPAGRPTYLDYVTLVAPVALQYGGKGQLSFRNFSATPGAVAQHRIGVSGAASTLQLWGRTAEGLVTSLSVAEQGGALTFTGAVTDGAGRPVEYTLFAPADAYPVEQVVTLPHGGVRLDTVPDYLMITTEALRPAAERLAIYHREHSGLRVQVVTQQELFDEYNGGTPDATAYRLMLWDYKQRYEAKHGAGSYHPLLLLMGDGAYDNRKVSQDWSARDFQLTEFLLTYQGENSTNVYSYSTDDYFGLLSEGQRGVGVGAQTLSVGIGRLPVRTLAEAEAVVDKIIRYDSEQVPGVWRTRACYVADNMDGYSHLSQADRIAQLMERLQPELIVSKVYMDAYAHKNVGGRTSVPDARRKLMDELQKGLLLLDYTGHGGPAAWSDEQILTQADIVRFDYPHLPVWITATCDFTNYDHPQTSAGESAMLNPTSGAIALYTTTRVVMDVANEQMNRALHESLFTPQADGFLRPMGIVMRDAKNALTNDTTNKLNFFLLGDPALRLRMPAYETVITELAGVSLDNLSEGEAVPLHAMDSVQVRGYVASSQGVVQGDFTGRLFVTVFDAKAQVKTHIDNAPDKDPDEIRTFEDYSGMLYAGIAEVKEGHFDFSFVVPKDLPYSGGNGKINLYAYSDAKGSEPYEAMGVSHAICVKPGVGEHSVVDTIPPEIRELYLGHPNFSMENPIGSTPLFVATLADASGINLSGTGVGHNMTLVVDGREDLTFNLNSSYTASEMEAGVGRVLYLLPELPDGDHTATFTVWDVCNNVTVRSFAFRVRAGQAPAVVESRARPGVLTADDPLIVEVYNNAPGVEVDVTIELYDYRGALVALSPQMVARSGYDTPALIRWEPKLQSGGALLPGLYIYRLRMTQGDSVPAYTSGKIVVR